MQIRHFRHLRQKPPSFFGKPQTGSFVTGSFRQALATRSSSARQTFVSTVFVFGIDRQTLAKHLSKTTRLESTCLGFPDFSGGTKARFTKSTVCGTPISVLPTLERGRFSEVQTTRDTPRKWRATPPLRRAKISARGGSGMGATGPFGGGGCGCDTCATHSKLRKEPRRGCSYTLQQRDRRGVASAPLSPQNLRWAKTRFLKTDTRVSKRAF